MEIFNLSGQWTYEVRSVIKFVTNAWDNSKKSKSSSVLRAQIPADYSKRAVKKTLDLVGFDLFARKRDFIELLSFTCR